MVLLPGSDTYWLVRAWIFQRYREQADLHRLYSVAREELSQSRTDRSLSTFDRDRREQLRGGGKNEGSRGHAAISVTRRVVRLDPHDSTMLAGHARELGNGCVHVDEVLQDSNTVRGVEHAIAER